MKRREYTYLQPDAFIVSAENSDLYGTKYKSAAAWFLGPTGENEALFQYLLGTAVSEHVEARSAYMPSDKPYITPDIMAPPEYKQGVAQLKNELQKLTKTLKVKFCSAGALSSAH